MNAPTIIVGLVILVIFVSIIARGIHNRKHHKGGCGCGCSTCPGACDCHPK